MTTFQTLAALTAAAMIPPSVPVRYQGEAVVITRFVEDVAAYCPIKVKPGFVLIACHQRLPNGQSILTLPLPCGRGEFYADIVCHEVGHAKGWPATHGG